MNTMISQPREAKVLFLCIALASSEHHKLSLKQALATSSEPASTTLAYLSKNLRGVVTRLDDGESYYEGRHPLIALVIVERIADRTLLLEAYKGLLPVLAHEIGRITQYGNRISRLYRRLVNHLEIYRRFSEQIEFARDIYESIKRFVNEDYHFWLQYGSLELEFGELSYAANYLAQAEALLPYDNFVLTALGHLKYRQAREADNYHTALDLREEGKAIILDQIGRRFDYSAHPFHIFGSQELAFANRWSKGKSLEEFRDILKNASDVVASGLKVHFKSRDLKQLSDDLKFELLSSAVRGIPNNLEGPSLDEED